MTEEEKKAKRRIQVRDSVRRWRLNHPGRANAFQKKYAKNHAEETYKQNRAYQENNRPKVRAWSRSWRLENKETARRMTREWNHANSDRRNEASKARECLKSKAMPPWADRKAILKFYQEARRLTRETSVPHHVDHVWPLKGVGFVGLHVPWNLQILTAAANISKSNRAPA